MKQLLEEMLALAIAASSGRTAMRQSWRRRTFRILVIGCELGATDAQEGRRPIGHGFGERAVAIELHQLEAEPRPSSILTSALLLVACLLGAPGFQ